MTSYLFSSQVGQSIAFDADNDVLNIGAAASALSLTQSGTSVIVTVSGVGSVTLTGTTLGELTSTNIDDITDGTLIIGDNTTSDALDALANTSAAITAATDALVYGMGGADILDVSGATTGTTVVFGGTGETDSTDGGDTITLNTGNTTVYSNAGNDGITMGITASGKTATVNSGLGNDTVNLAAAAAGSSTNINLAAGNDTIADAAVAGSLTITGGAGDDIINIGSATGDATVYGGTGEADSTDGADTVTLGAHNVVAYTNAGADVIEVRGKAGGTSVVNAGIGNDTITDNAGAAGSHTVSGGLGADTITLDANGPTSIIVYGGQGSTDTGDGADTIAVTDAGALATATIYGNADADTITLTSTNAHDVAATINGGLGNDTVTLSLGGSSGDAVTVEVGAGDDNVSITTGAFDATVTISGFEASSDNITLNFNSSAAADMSVAWGGSTVVIDDNGSHGALVFTGFVGNFDANNMTFSDGSALITNYGGAAATLEGATTGSDQLIAGSNGDTFSYDDADWAAGDVVTGGAGTDVLTFTDSTNISAAELANKTSIETVLFGDFDSDIVLGTAATAAGITLVNGAALTAGQDLGVTDTGAVATDYTVTGGADADSIVLDAATGDLTITGNGGGDTLTTNSGTDTIDGGTGDDVIVAGAGDDSITAGTGSDTVTGDDGADIISLSTGTDRVRYAALTDGSAAGTDNGTFSGYDVVTGFTTGTDDVQFATAAFLAGGNDSNNAITDTATGVIGTTTTLTIDLDTNDTDELVILTNADSSQFADADYIVDVVNAAIAGGALNSATNDTAIFVLQGAASSAVYYFTEDDGTDTTVNEADFTMIGTFDTQLAAGDIGVY